MDSKLPLKFLVSGYTGLGNFVLKTPMLLQLKKMYPNSEIHLITGNSFGIEYLLKNSNLINKTHELKMTSSYIKKIFFFIQLRSYKFDVLFLPFDAAPNFLLYGSFFANISKRVLHVFENSKKISFFKKKLIIKQLLGTTLLVSLKNNTHEIDLNFDLLEALYDKPFERKYDTFVSIVPNPQVLLKWQLIKKQYVVIQAGAANGLYDVKRWQTANFIAIIEKIISNTTLKVVLVGDSGDYKKAILPIVEHFINNKQVINTAANTSINDLLNLLQNANLVVCHDSGVMHISNALQTPLIALYGPTDFERTRPLAATSEVLVAKNLYTHIMKNFATTEKELADKGITFEAMDNLEVEEVWQMILKIMQ